MSHPALSFQQLLFLPLLSLMPLTETEYLLEKSHTRICPYHSLLLTPPSIHKLAPASTYPHRLTGAIWPANNSTQPPPVPLNAERGNPPQPSASLWSMEHLKLKRLKCQIPVSNLRVGILPALEPLERGVVRIEGEDLSHQIIHFPDHAILTFSH